jgi:hypothetical protein
MRPILGTYREGRVHLDAPVDWPEGVRVAIVPDERVGLPEEEWPSTPEGRAALVARLDAIGPLDITPEEEAEIRSARSAVREASLRAVARQMGLEP